METWIDIKGYEGKYEVSDFGNVRSIVFRFGKRKTPIFLKQQKNKKGYLRVWLCKDGKHNMQRVHRIVARAFISNPENKLDINHKNGIKNDNRPENLEWVTELENHRHAVKHGFHPHGETHGRSKLTEKDVKKIREIISTKQSTQKFICNSFGVTRTTVQSICKYKTWKHVA